MEEIETTPDDPKRPVTILLVVTEMDYKALKLIRNYFRENDRNQLEHLAYDVLDRVIKQKNFNH